MRYAEMEAYVKAITREISKLDSELAEYEVDGPGPVSMDATILKIEALEIERSELRVAMHKIETRP